jgi:hypothetical protein
MVTNDVDMYYFWYLVFVQNINRIHTYSICAIRFLWLYYLKYAGIRVPIRYPDAELTFFQFSARIDPDICYM